MRRQYSQLLTGLLRKYKHNNSSKRDAATLKVKGADRIFFDQSALYRKEGQVR